MRYCAKLFAQAVSDERSGRKSTRVDVCGLEHGHAQLEHHGRYTGTIWRAGKTVDDPPTLLGYSESVMGEAA